MGILETKPARCHSEMQELHEIMRKRQNTTPLGDFVICEFTLGYKKSIGRMLSIYV